MISKILPWLAGAAWGTLVFMLGMQLFFPSTATVERLQYELERVSDGGWQLQADKAGLWRATGLKLKGVELLKVDKPKRARRVSDDEEPEAPTATRFLVADHIALRAQLLPLLGGSKQASFDADLYKGDLSGTAGMKGDAINTGGEASEIDIGLIPFEGETLSLDLDGALDASWDLVIDTADIAKSTGAIELEVAGLMLNSASIAGMDFDESGSFQKCEFKFEIDDGKAKVKKGALEGDLLEAELDGDISLNKKIDRSRLRLELVFTLAEHIDNLVKILPGAKDARRDDGEYHFSITGTLFSPSFRAKKERRTASRARKSTPSTRAPATLPGGLGGADDEVEDPDERRRLREERIRERRERLRERREAAKEEREDENDEFVDELDEFDDEDEFLDDGPDFEDDLPEPIERYEDVEIMDAPFDDEELDEFEDDF